MEKEYICLEHISKKFDSAVVLKDLNAALHKGEILGFLGPVSYTHLEGPTEAFVAQVQKNVVDWLFDHIKVFDRAVAEYKG